MASKPLQDIPFPEPCVVTAIVRSGETIPPNPNEIIQEGDHLYLVASRESMDKFGDMFTQPHRPVQNVVIFGGDRIGLLLAEGLQKRGVSVKVIEENLARCQEIAAVLQHAVVVQGNATDRDFLIEQGVTSADAFVSTAANDELNILCALLAKNIGVPRSLIVLNNPGYVRLAEAIGVDLAISPLLLTAGKITHFVLHGGAISATFVGGKELQAIEFVTGSTASIVDKKISEAGLPKEAIVGAIIHNDTVIIPPNDSVILLGDHVIVISPLSATPSVERLFK
ncbi:MAG: NAD-binding protein, partial [Dehalococcoidales bacterium]